MGKKKREIRILYNYQTKSGEIVQGIKTENGEFYSIQDLQEYFNKKEKQDEESVKMDKLAKRLEIQRENNFLKKLTELNDNKFSIEITGEFLIRMFQNMEFAKYFYNNDSAIKPLVENIKELLSAAVSIKELE